MKKRELEEEEIFDEDDDDFDSDEYSDIPNIKVDADDFEVKDETLDQIKKRFLEIGKKEKRTWRTHLSGSGQRRSEDRGKTFGETGGCDWKNGSEDIKRY